MSLRSMGYVAFGPGGGYACAVCGVRAMSTIDINHLAACNEYYEAEARKVRLAKAEKATDDAWERNR